LIEKYYKLLNMLRSNPGKCIESEDVGLISIIKRYESYIVKELYSGRERLCVKTLLPMALDLLKLGADPQEVSKYLDWKDFEELVSIILSGYGMDVIRNYRFNLKRYEIDVIGIDLTTKYALVIDCKHWRPGYRKKGKLVEAVKVHKLRVKYLSEFCSSIVSQYPSLSKVKYFIPVIVTLTDALKGVIDNVFIVPIRFLRDFINNIEHYVELLGTKSLVMNKCFIKTS